MNQFDIELFSGDFDASVLGSHVVNISWHSLSVNSADSNTTEHLNATSPALTVYIRYFAISIVSDTEN